MSLLKVCTYFYVTSGSDSHTWERMPALISIPLTSNAEEVEVERFYEDLQDLLELTPKKDVLFIIGDWNAKAGSQEIPGVTGKFGLGVQNEAGQRLTVVPRECTGHNLAKSPVSKVT